MSRTFIIMGIDELGDEFRAHGSDFLEDEHTFPDFEDEDEAMWEAFQAWENAIWERATKEWNEIYGCECHMRVVEEDRSKYNRIYPSYLELPESFFNLCIR